MKQLVNFKGFAVAAILFAAVSGCGSDDEETSATGSQDIVKTAQSQDSLSTLVAAIQAAELASTLSTTKNLTVLA